MALTKAKLARFIRIRNKSGLSSNLQFQFDADEAGIKLDDLGDAIKRFDGTYVWHTPFGQLVEAGPLRLIEPDSSTIRAGHQPYPPAMSTRSGARVGWRSYRYEDEAKVAAESARHNAAIDEGNGHDFGFCAPGSISKIDAGFEVCVP